MSKHVKVSFGEKNTILEVFLICSYEYLRVVTDSLEKLKIKHRTLIIFLEKFGCM